MLARVYRRWHICLLVNTSICVCLQMLACVYGRRLIEVDCLVNMPLSELKRGMRGAIQQGAWLHLRQSRNLSPEVPPFVTNPG